MWFALAMGCRGPDDRPSLGTFDEASDDEASEDADSAADTALGADCVDPVTGWVTVDLPGPRESMGVGADDQRVYVLGGWTPVGATDEVWVGTVGPASIDWVDGPRLPGALEHPAAGLAGGRLWVIGGDTTAGAVLDTVYTAAVDDGGAVGAWVTAAPLPAPVTFAAGASSGAHLYVIGGLGSFFEDARTDVYRLEPGEGGAYSLVADRSLPEGRFAAGASIHEGALYVAGGAPSFVRDAAEVWRAEIGDDGSLGPYALVSTLPTGLVTPAVAAVGDRLVVGGGLSGWSDAQKAVWELDLTDGQSRRLAPFGTTRLGHGAARVGDHWVVLGGWASWQGAQMHDTGEIGTICTP